MTIETFLQQLRSNPEAIQFSTTMAIIEAHYRFTPTAFKNGKIFNAAGENSGSCKLLSFAKLHELSPEQTLHCFGDYYRKDVLQNPQNNDHQNIRNFIESGWAGVRFENNALTLLVGE